MVSGCVSSITNNEIGVSSVGWAVKIMGVNSSSGGGTLQSAYEGVLAAAQMGADIINLSWGNSSYWESNEIVINTVYSEYGCILVGAAGNDGVYEPHYPAAYEYVISVTATSMNNYFNCWEYGSNSFGCHGISFSVRNKEYKYFIFINSFTTKYTNFNFWYIGYILSFKF